MSYKSWQNPITRLGENHDGKVLKWCEKLKLTMLRNVSVHITVLLLLHTCIQRLSWFY